VYPDGTYADDIGVDVRTVYQGHASPEEAFGLPRPAPPAEADTRETR
jgi:hypothetical protein